MSGDDKKEDLRKELEKDSDAFKEKYGIPDDDKQVPPPSGNPTPNN